MAKPKMMRLIGLVGTAVGWVGLISMIHQSITSDDGYGRQLSVFSKPTKDIDPLSRKPVMLYGIFTTKSETSRRELIRNTMLTTLPETILCSLQDHLRAVRTNSGRTKSCRIMYTFVVGYHDEGDHPQEHIDDEVPITISPHQVNNSEPDVVYLNIKENMKTGKTPTWFKFASFLTEKFGIDYIAKADTDTFMWMPALLDFISNDLPPKPKPGRPDHRRIYGGFMVDSNICGGQDYAPCKILFGKIYMAGMFYFISSDIADYLNGDEIDRTYFVRHEDYDFGMRVLSHPLPVKLTVMNTHPFWLHTNDTKVESGWMRLWDEYKAGDPAFKGFMPQWWPRARTGKSRAAYEAIKDLE